ncbi:ABC transporter substrate-binding protein [Burkholderia sp. WSM2232]|uniref:ABC transporter substrate-binding protein n=1 Tax=Burkholderia sp. WSM2232 TaxID=944436 RepID=UPI000411085D|nr:ABC transporter substrate-binding protein [Burkholderia sp. WSM2232]
MKPLKIVPLAAALLCCAFSTAYARDLTVVSVGGTLQDAYRAAYWKPYQQQAGQHLIEDINLVGLSKAKAMVEGNNVTWDLVQMDEEDVVNGCDQGLLEQVDWARAAPATAGIPRSEITRCGVASMIWANVLAYDGGRIKDGPKSWADFWDVKRWPGKRGLRKQAKQTLEIALLADGVAPADVYKVLATPAGQDRAFAKLDQLKPYIQWWDAGAQPVEWLASGAVAMTSAYNGRIDAANKEGRQLRIVWKNEIYGPTFWVVLKGSPNKAAAVRLIDYMSGPQQQVRFSQLVPYGPANRQALASLPAAALANLPNAPQNLQGPVLQNTAFWADHLDELQQRFARWSSN